MTSPETDAVWERRRRVLNIIDDLHGLGVPKAATAPVADWLVADVLRDPVAAVHFARMLADRATRPGATP